MAMVLMNQLNYDVCDMINKVVMKDHKRQKIIDDYEDLLNNNNYTENNHFYNIEIVIQYKTQSYQYKQKSIEIVDLDKDEAYKKYQMIIDYTNLNIDNEIVGIYMILKSSFIDGDGFYCFNYSDDGDLLTYYEVPNYQELKEKYDENDYWYKKEWVEEFDEDYFLERYNEIKELYDNDELEFYDNGSDDTSITFNKYQGKTEQIYICKDCKRDFTDEVDDRSGWEGTGGNHICMDCFYKNDNEESDSDSDDEE